MSLLTELDRLDWREFEHLCLILFERYFDAPDANFYGANNFGQDGIDIRLTTTKGDAPARVVIQCKAMQSLDWSHFSRDFRRALDTFARKTIGEGRAFTFIVATTAEIENTRKFDAKRDELIQELGLGDIGDRIHFHVYTAPRLQTMAQHNTELRELFYRSERPADKHMTQELIRLNVRLTRHADRNELASAQRDVGAYLHAAKPSEPEKYNWVPTVLFDQIAYLTLAAGDFERANKLLNAALGADPLYARYQLGFLRARRVLHAAPWHNLPRAHMFEQPVAIPSPEEDVVDMAPQLLAALGQTDEQLTLALWVISYAGEQDLAEQGLNRALGLVAQAWPSNLERLDKDARYVLSEEGYLDRLSASRAKKRLPASSEHLRACALTVGYSYIRSVHVARFGFESVRRVEDAHEGWAEAIEGISRDNATTFFSGLQPLCQRAMRTYFPSLLAEGSGREFGRDHGDRITQTAPPRLESRMYAATPQFLLRDCEDRLVGRRVDELAHGGFIGTGATILISHLGLERLIQVQLGERLGLNEGRIHQQASAIVEGIAHILGRLRRCEPGGDQRSDGQKPPFESRPCYSNFAAAERVNSGFASIELARSMRLPFLASSASEWHLAGAELPKTEKNLFYWKPVSFPARM
jgi:hypothetical protein